jgi:hypothetical protein
VTKKALYSVKNVNFCSGRLRLRAVEKEQCPDTFRGRGKKEMKVPQTASSAALYLDRMDPAIQNRQIIDLSRTAFGLPVPVIQAALMRYQHLLAAKLFHHGSQVDGEQVVFCIPDRWRIKPISSMMLQIRPAGVVHFTPVRVVEHIVPV